MKMTRWQNKLSSPYSKWVQFHRCRAQDVSKLHIRYTCFQTVSSCLETDILLTSILLACIGMSKLKVKSDQSRISSSSCISSIISQINLPQIATIGVHVNRQSKGWYGLFYCINLLPIFVAVLELLVVSTWVIFPTKGFAPVPQTQTVVVTCILLSPINRKSLVGGFLIPHGWQIKCIHTVNS